MLIYQKNWIALLTLLIIGTGCSKKIKQQEDEIYSRHLQEHVKLTIISTPIPEIKNEMNLLILNDGQDIDKFRIKIIVDSLYRKKQIAPLLVVAVHAGKREEWYGVAGKPDFENRGKRADKYAAFVDNELYPFIKKNAGVRSFKSVVIAGASLGGLSAMDIAWNNADKIDRVGVFSGSFWWRDKDQVDISYTDAADRILLNSVQQSRKRPHLKYWMYAGLQEEKSDRDKDGIIDVVDDTKDLLQIIENKKVCSASDIVYVESPNGQHDYASWSKVLPDFLIWAFGN